MARAVVISACALPMTLLTTSSVHADCGNEGGGGLFTGVTGELCRLTTGLSGDLADAVDKGTGDALDRVADGVDGTTGKAGEALTGAGERLDGDRPSRPTKPDPDSPPSDPEKPPPCVPGLLSSPCDEGGRDDGGQGGGGGDRGEGLPPPSQRPGGGKGADGPGTAGGRHTGPVEAGDAIPGHPHSVSLVRPATPMVAVPFLWPGHGLDGLRTRGDGTVRGSGPDPAEGALMAALVLSAVLAARIISLRRRKPGEHASMPFEPHLSP